MITLLSWNINGIRAAIKKDIWEKLEVINPDLLCVQETKADSGIMQGLDEKNLVWKSHFHSCTMKKGYSGVANFTKNIESTSMFDTAFGQESTNSFTTEEFQAGLKIDKFDVEGRIIITKHTITNPKTEIKNFIVINGYYPQGGRGQDRIDYKIEFYKEVYELANKLRNNGENVLLCGDFNTTITDIDLARPDQNRKTTGCLPEEREVFNLFLKNNFVDTFRHFYPEKTDMYSYWDQITRARERNVGWRIDYWLADKKLIPFITDAFILTDVMGSDHAPVGVTLNI
jgi:exodeoxyribonuclease III